METTYFTINKRRHLYIKSGFMVQHQTSCKNTWIHLDKIFAGWLLWCTKASNLLCSYWYLAKSVGKHATSHSASAASKTKQNINSESATNTSMRRKSQMKTATPILIYIFWIVKNILLHHHRLNVQDENIRNEAAHELLNGNSIFLSLAKWTWRCTNKNPISRHL